MAKIEDLRGQVFGKLTVVWKAANQVTEAGHSRAQWMCRCECGESVIKPARTLKRLKIGGCDSCNKVTKPSCQYERSIHGFMIRKVKK